MGKHVADQVHGATETPEPEEKVKNESFTKFLLGLMVNTVLLVGGLAVLVAVGGSVFGFYRIETVLSGSMRPDYPPGSVVVAFEKPKEKVQTGDVIIFVSPEQYGGETVTHRVISARLTDTGEVYVRTKGDANNAPDPWEARVTAAAVWEVRGGVPYVGYVSYYARQWWPMLLAVGAAIPMLGFANNRVRDAYGRKTK